MDSRRDGHGRLRIRSVEFARFLFHSDDCRLRIKPLFWIDMLTCCVSTPIQE